MNTTFMRLGTRNLLALCVGGLLSACGSKEVTLSDAGEAGVSPQPDRDSGGPSPSLVDGGGPSPSLVDGGGPSPSLVDGGGPAPSPVDGGGPAPSPVDGGGPAPSPVDGGEVQDPEMQKKKEELKELKKQVNLLSIFETYDRISPTEEQKQALKALFQSKGKKPPIYSIDSSSMKVSLTGPQGACEAFRQTWLPELKKRLSALEQELQGK